MLLMSPSMPSGGTFDEEDWSLVCDLCRDRDLFLIYDAAMERLLFDGRPLVHPLRLEGMAERTLVVGSLSKEHRMIGWRVGWVAGPAATIEDVGWAHVYNTTTPVGIARAAARPSCAATRGTWPSASPSSSAAATPCSTRCPDWPFVSPAGGWSLFLDVAELGFAAPRPRVSCSRSPRSRRPRWSAGAAPWPSATCASSSAPSRSSGWRRSRERLAGTRWQPRREPALVVSRLAPVDAAEGLAELHTHLGGSVASEILWSLAHEQGIALPVKDYWEFDRLVTVDPRGVPDLDALDAIYHWTELIQSSPLAVERSVHAAIGGAYRSQSITTSSSASTR